MSNVSAFELDDFFSSNELENWRAVLAPGMHYQLDLFQRAEAQGVSDAELEAGMERDVRVLYPHIPKSTRVFDVGYGWGGAASMLIENCGCESKTSNVDYYEY
jgi:cyclopropane fatty-acyl-phospholipid synthase-like methyltransferase